MKIAEIRDLATPELIERIEAEVKAYQQKKINHSISPLDSPAVITKSRREIARMKTELRKRTLENKK
jgi:large subunit ribosomal protein L29